MFLLVWASGLKSAAPRGSHLGSGIFLFYFNLLAINPLQSQSFLGPLGHALGHFYRGAEPAEAFGRLAALEVAGTWAMTHQLAPAGYLYPLSDGFIRLHLWHNNTTFQQLPQGVPKTDHSTGGRLIVKPHPRKNCPQKSSALNTSPWIG